MSIIVIKNINKGNTNPQFLIVPLGSAEYIRFIFKSLYNKTQRNKNLSLRGLDKYNNPSYRYFVKEKGLVRELVHRIIIS